MIRNTAPTLSARTLKLKLLEEKKDIITDLVETGADISGSVAGSVIGGLLAGPAGMIIGGASGPIITKAFKQIGSEILQRFIGPREGVRIGAAYAFAIQKLKENQSNGRGIRNDSFFEARENERPAAEEIFEGIILGVQKEYEERKVRFLGNLYANICSDNELTREHANQLIKTSNNLSYRQFCILQLLQDKKVNSNSLHFKVRGLADNRIFQADIIIEIRDLQQKGLLSITARINDTDDNSAAIAQDDIVITNSGTTFCEMLSLKEISREELDQLNDLIKLKLQ